MQIGKLENKAWLSLALVVLALLFAVSFSLSLYSKSNEQLATQRLQLIRLQSALLATALSQSGTTINDSTLADLLRKYKVAAYVACFSDRGEKLSSATTLEKSPAFEVKPSPQALSSSAGGSPQAVPEEVSLVARDDYYLAEFSLPLQRSLILAFPAGDQSSSFFFYLFSYQVVALVAGLALLYFVVRRLMRPYRRVVEAAQGSPVRATSAKSESEFVVETFQALIRQLQTKEVELERLHSLERRRAEKSERFSERLIVNLPSGLVAVNSKGVVTTANVQARRLCQLLDARADSARLLDLDSHLDGMTYEAFFLLAPRMTELISRCLQSGIIFRREEVEVRQKDGRVRQLGVSVSPILDAEQNIEGTLCLMTDITEVTELRERIKLQETLANLGEMAAGLAHEFKNSLATIQGYAQLFDAQSEVVVSPNRRRDTLDSMMKEVSLLSRLVSDFLNFARPQRLTLSDVNLEEMISDCLDEVRPQLGAGGIRITVRGTFPLIAADELLLRRAFVNLIRNAAEAIDADATERRVEVIGSVDVDAEPAYAHLRILDTGRGISSEDLQNIFIPFFTTKSRGYGIGLAIVQKVIVAHGGDVTVERSDASGTVFHCRLPLQASPLFVEAAS